MGEHILDVLRTEQKYTLSFLEAELMYARLGALLHADVHNGMNGYTVRSLYFDTPDDSDYQDKADGLELRRKLRLRVYGPGDASAKLELKEKQGEYQRKRSLLLSREDAQALCAGDREVLRRQNSEFAMELYGRICERQYMPKCIVEYQRRAFMAKENNIRLTFDSRICATESSMELFNPFLPLNPVFDVDKVIFEVKYDRFMLGYISDIISTVNRRSVSSSKYCLSRSVGYPLQV